MLTAPLLIAKMVNCRNGNCGKDSCSKCEANVNATQATGFDEAKLRDVMKDVVRSEITMMEERMDTKLTTLKNELKAELQAFTIAEIDKKVEPIHEELNKMNLELNKIMTQLNSDAVIIKGLQYSADEVIDQSLNREDKKKALDKANNSLITKTLELMSEFADVTVQDISEVVRLGRPSAGDAKPKMVKLRISNRRTRSQILREKMKLNQEGSKYKGVYIEEDLSKSQRNLFDSVRLDEKTAKTWTMDGRIYTVLKSDSNKKICMDNVQALKDSLNWSQDKINEICRKK